MNQNNNNNNNQSLSSSSSSSPSSSSELLLCAASASASAASAAADVHVVPMLSDNYGYVIVDRATKKAACVDAVNPSKMMKIVEDLSCSLAAVLTTHKHLDHSGGNEEFLKLLSSSSSSTVPFIGSGYEETPGVTQQVKDGDIFSIGELQGRVIHAPCHTRGHLLFYIYNTKDESLAPLLFTGDTLFIAGCGRFFEGDANQMISNMTKIAQLPNKTRLYVGHEYTVKNLEFAHSIEPENDAVKTKLDWAKSMREKGFPTVPSILAEEKTFNPFMRFNDAKLMKSLKTQTAVETMKECRALKDRF